MVAKSNNQMWRLDFLEAKFHNYQPRFPHTKKLLTARNSKLLKRIPASKEEAESEILALKSECFERKYYGSYKKLEKEITKAAKNDTVKFAKDEIKRSVVEFLGSKDKIDLLIKSKLAKSITASILINKELKTNPPKYISQEVRSIIMDKTNESNPSNFFITFCQNDKELNKYFSSLWNSKNIKSIVSEIEWSFKVVRGNLTKQEKDARKKVTGKDISEDEEDGQQDGSEADSESSSDDDDDKDENENENENEGEMDIDEAYEKFAIYDKLVGDSDGEEERLELDPNVNYNEITDEEPSEEIESELDSEVEKSDSSQDSFFDDSESDGRNQKKKKKETPKEYNLPQLASGYFSGGSDDEDDDIDNDKVVKEITTQRKNRRGQRARQKIWAKKYGKEAKHIKSEREQLASEREQRQKEYEERCRKRELKAKLAAPSGSNVEPLGDRKSRSSTPTVAPQVPVVQEAKMHPSWEAKRIAEEKLKNVKFQGKKITFD
ncbi:Bud-site selection protein [Scheffersomyces xylosifermentans]|uniref:Bud-site selection protein n=1 Tax=Scheffersomyces xylosifermentans TaxID=1304137 RepID=UPI00315C765A